MTNEQLRALIWRVLIFFGVWNALITIALVLLVSKAWGQSPASEVKAALQYVQQHPTYASEYRFLSLQGVATEKRFEVARATSYVLNSLASAGTIRNPELIKGSQLMVFRLSSYWPKNPEYGAAHAAWEALSTNPKRIEPYFHARSVQTDSKESSRVVVVNGGWLNLADADQLCKLTKSVGPIVRADWFCAVASVPPAYYQFASISKTREEYFKLLGVDEKLIIDNRAVRAANIPHSDVTSKLRRIERWPAIRGPIWGTKDSVDASDLAKDVFHVPDFSLKYEAGEYIAAKRNGLFEYSLFDFAGARLDAVDPNLAIDYTVSPPVTLVPMLSCIRCHSIAVADKPENGLRSFTDFQHRLASGRLASTDPETIDLLASLYAPQDRLQRDLERDRQDFVATVARLAKGATPATIGQALAATVADYQDVAISPAQAAKELGIEPDSFQKLVGESNLATIGILCMGENVLRGQWEISFGQAATLALANSGGKR